MRKQYLEYVSNQSINAHSSEKTVLDSTDFHCMDKNNETSLKISPLTFMFTFMFKEHEGGYMMIEWSLYYMYVRGCVDRTFFVIEGYFLAVMGKSESGPSFWQITLRCVVSVILTLSTWWRVALADYTVNGQQMWHCLQLFYWCVSAFKHWLSAFIN